MGLYNGLFLRGIHRTSEIWVRDGGVGLVGVGEMGMALGGRG